MPSLGGSLGWRTPYHHAARFSVSMPSRGGERPALWAWHDREELSTVQERD